MRIWGTDVVFQTRDLSDCIMRDVKFLEGREIIKAFNLSKTVGLDREDSQVG